MMTPNAAVMRQADEAGVVLDVIRSALDHEEREHLALELLDATRAGEDGYGRVVVPWALTILVRQQPEYEMQVKEFRNLELSGELFKGTPFEPIAGLDIPVA